MAAVLVEARKNGATDPVVLLARPAALGRGLPVGPDDLRSDLPLRLRHPRRRGRRLRLHVGGAGPRPAPPPVYVVGYATGVPDHDVGCRCTGRSTTSWGSARRRPGACGTRRSSGRATSTCHRSTTASPPSSTSGWRRSGFCPDRARRTVSSRTAASTATARAAAGALRRRGAGQRAHARRPADARVLPAAVRPGRRAPTRSGLRRAGLPFLAALRRRRRLQRRAVLSCEPYWSEAHESRLPMTWVERAADRSPGRATLAQPGDAAGQGDRRGGTAAHAVNGSTFTMQELVKDAGVALRPSTDTSRARTSCCWP